LDSFQKNAKKVNFFTIWVVLRENRSVKRHFFPALGIGRCYKNLEYTWIIAEQTDVSDLSAINHVIRTGVRTHFRRVPF